jgi:two-component system, chemotaxis family, chemotaxis protein CheY
VRTGNYFGPERRRRNDPSYNGPRRRASDGPQAGGGKDDKDR